MSVIDIAKQRNITTGTVENHLSEFVATGEVNVFDFLSPGELDEIREAVKKVGDNEATLSVIKSNLGDAISYAQVRMGLSYLKKQ
jgi:ATP-dependent DNA helicase RecQ